MLNRGDEPEPYTTPGKRQNRFFFDNPHAAAYVTPSNLTGDNKVEEQIVGLIGYSRVGEVSPQAEPVVEFFVTDPYFRLHPQVYIRRDNQENAYLYKHGSARGLFFDGVPVDIDGRTYKISAIDSRLKRPEYDWHINSIIVSTYYLADSRLADNYLCKISSHQGDK